MIVLAYIQNEGSGGNNDDNPINRPSLPNYPVVPDGNKSSDSI